MSVNINLRKEENNSEEDEYLLICLSSYEGEGFIYMR